MFLSKCDNTTCNIGQPWDTFKFLSVKNWKFYQATRKRMYLIPPSYLIHGPWHKVVTSMCQRIPTHNKHTQTQAALYLLLFNASLWRYLRNSTLPIWDQYTANIWPIRAAYIRKIHAQYVHWRHELCASEYVQLIHRNNLIFIDIFYSFFMKIAPIYRQFHA